MMKFCVLMMAFAAITPVMVAQSPTQPSSVTVPTQFANAHTLFLASGGAGDIGTREKEAITMMYTSAYNALSTAGRYHLVGAPSEADLSAVISIEAGTNADGSGFIRLAVYDTKTHALLWNIDERLGGAFRKNSFQKNIDESMAKVVDDLKALAAGKLP